MGRGTIGMGCGTIGTGCGTIGMGCGTCGVAWATTGVVCATTGIAWETATTPGLLNETLSFWYLGCLRSYGCISCRSVVWRGIATFFGLGPRRFSMSVIEWLPPYGVGPGIYLPEEIGDVFSIESCLGCDGPKWLPVRPVSKVWCCAPAALPCAWPEAGLFPSSPKASSPMSSRRRRRPLTTIVPEDGNTTMLPSTSRPFATSLRCTDKIWRFRSDFNPKHPEHTLQQNGRCFICTVRICGMFEVGWERSKGENSVLEPFREKP